ncbi:MAG: ATPase [Microbacterium sp.]
MKSVLWFVLGLTGGFVAAHFVSKDPRGHELLADVDARISEFTDRIGEAYRAQEAKIDGIAAEVKEVAADALDAAKDAAAKLTD